MKSTRSWISCFRVNDYWAWLKILRNIVQMNVNSTSLDVSNTQFFDHIVSLPVTTHKRRCGGFCLVLSLWQLYVTHTYVIARIIFLFRLATLFMCDLFFSSILFVYIFAFLIVGDINRGLCERDWGDILSNFLYHLKR